MTTYTRMTHESDSEYEARVRVEMSQDRYGRDRHDVQEKAHIAIAERARAAFAADRSKPLDVHYAEAVKEQFRRDPQLAREWKEAPGKFSSN